LVDVHRRFGGKNCLHLQGKSIGQTRNHQEACKALRLLVPCLADHSTEGDLENYLRERKMKKWRQRSINREE
jgi:hypothetical protein